MVDLFAGCGGLTAGFVATGRFRPVAAVELDAEAAATYAANFGEHVYVGDIADWVQRPLPAAEVVVGGPPCQGFSTLGRQDPSDPRNLLWERYVEALTRIRPVFFVLENVPQFLQSPQFQRLRRLTQGNGRLREWALEAFELNAADYGLGQSRRRAVVVGRQRGIDPLGPPPTVGLNPNLSDVLTAVDPAVTTIDLPDSAIEVNGRVIPGAFKSVDLHVTRRPTPLSLRRFRHIPSGGSRRDLPDELLTPCWRRHRTGSHDVMGRLRWDRPSVTIRTEFFKPEKGRYLHPDEDRPITHYEAALIQGFEDAFLWCGSKVSIARQIGNAVPPPLAAAIAGHLAKRL
jgi:DNA (cytosine-5)-methyltransferase 1